MPASFIGHHGLSSSAETSCKLFQAGYELLFHQAISFSLVPFIPVAVSKQAGQKIGEGMLLMPAPLQLSFSSRQSVFPLIRRWFLSVVASQ